MTVLHFYAVCYKIGQNHWCFASGELQQVGAFDDFFDEPNIQTFETKEKGAHRPCTYAGDLDVLDLSRVARSCQCQARQVLYTVLASSMSQFVT